MSYTHASRAVLADARLVRQRLESECDDVRWRLDWILEVVLLRTIGHVFQKVDGQANQGVKNVANDLFSNWKSENEHQIFHQFIEVERNSILKEYETSMTSGPVSLSVQLRADDGTCRVEHFSLDENIYRPVHGGHYDGEDGRTLVDEALQWWEEQLDEVDRRVSEDVRTNKHSGF